MPNIIGAMLAQRRPSLRPKRTLGITALPLVLFDTDQYCRVFSHEHSTVQNLHSRGENDYDTKSRPSRSISATETSSFARAYGITRDQARRLINRIGKNRAKLDEAARILKARLPSRSASEAKHHWISPRSRNSIP
jgi:hypothetical protein